MKPEDRLHRLKAILRSLGCADASDILRIFGVDDFKKKESLAKRKTLYRDLEKLVDDGLVEALDSASMRPLADEIEDSKYDEKGVRRGCKNVWRWKGTNTDVRGGGHLIEHGGRISASRPVRSALKVDYLISEPDRKGHTHFVFLIGRTFFNLSIQKEELPLKILVGRKRDDGGATAGQYACEALGARGCVIELDIEVLSSHRNTPDSGQFLISIDKEGREILVEDLGSKNPTYGKSVSEFEVRSFHGLLGQAEAPTQSVRVADKMEKILASNLIQISKSEPARIKCPAYLEVKGFQALVL